MSIIPLRSGSALAAKVSALEAEIDNLIVYAASQEEEDAAFARGAKIVIRTDLIDETP